MSTIAGSLIPHAVSGAQTSGSQTSSSTSGGTSGAALEAATDPLASESTFLTLLVSQLQNQDPLDPVDSNQFVSQLTEYSQLEQLIGIHSDTTSLSQSASTTQTSSATGDQANADPASTTTSGTNSTTSTTGVN